MLRGFATISYWVDDMTAAKAWYTELLGVEPYFARPIDGPPAYVEYRIGDFQAELGLIDRKYAPPGASTEPGGVCMYWHVDDLDKTLEKLYAMGAKAYRPLTDRGAGFVTASVLDPFGNILSVMYNPHYVETVEKVLGAATR
jgi:predicted enzyme related to lactoylglutathione lyase